MCGLAGIFDFDGGIADPSLLQKMGEALRHRGPDADGVFRDPTPAPAVALVHRRLAIIDLSRGADQPIPSEDGRVVVALNGEIYNYRELREGLRRPHRFRSQGDSEVVVHLFEEKGMDAIADLDGMFALALWDAAERRLILARDAFGKKPLYYVTDGRRLVFGSEIKAVLAAGVPAQLDEAAFGEYLAFGYVPTPNSFFRGIRKLPPACALVADRNGVGEPKPYWDLRFPPAGATSEPPFTEAAERVRDHLSAAVRKRMVADVPLGVLLSGGLDSSAVAAMMSRIAPGKVHAFTVGFEQSPAYDESPHAVRVARHVGAEHYLSYVQPEAAALVDTLLHHHDEPFGDSSALPTYLIAREARRHVTVVLTGDGGDETFAGYDRFGAVLLAERLPYPMRRLLGKLAGILPEGTDHHSFLRRLRRFAEKAERPAEDRLLGWSSVFDPRSLPALCRGTLCDYDRIASSYRSALERCSGASLLSRLLYVNVRTYLLDDLLPKMDRMTMAHGLEARSPFLDRSLVEYVATLPDRFKRRGQNGKIVLRQAVADLLPRETLLRAKRGFAVPLGQWFRTELRPMVEDLLLSSPRLGRRLHTEAIRGLVQDHFASRADRSQRLWSLLTLELWLRKHGFD